MQFDGAQYGVPTDLSLHFLYFRKDLIDALMADEAAKTLYGDIAEQYLGERLEPKDPTTGHGAISPPTRSTSASR
jgi:multiple sugar transport system substrate-binding protein